MKVLGGRRIAIVGQAFPYQPIAHPRRLSTNWTFGIRDADLQKVVDTARRRTTPMRSSCCRTTAWMSI